MESIWSKTSSGREFPCLQGDRTADVAVIGGGLAGICIAYELQRNGVDAIVLEAAKVGRGQTQNTTAKITSQHGLQYASLIGDFGRERSMQYAQANEAAIKAYHSIVQEMQIDCDFEIMPSYLYSQKECDAIYDEAAAARSLGLKTSVVENTSLPFPIKLALCMDGQAMFHPLRFLYAIAADLTVYENTKVQSVEGHRIETDRGNIHADSVVFATHFPFVNSPGYYFLRMHQQRSYVLALQGAQTLDGMYLGIDEDTGFSLRNYRDLLLFGGAGHKTGQNAQGGQYEALRIAAADFWPKCRESAHWSAQDYMTLDNVPYIGRFSSSTPNWYVATGFRKWGMTSSMVSAMILSDLIAGKHNPYAEVFSPQRFEPTTSAVEFVKQGAASVKGLARSFLGLPDATLSQVPLEHAGIVELEGEKAGVYKDGDGVGHAVSVKCPHLGCELAWNPEEQSWDCPCHGSRFDIDGHLLNNPAQDDLDACKVRSSP